MGFPAILRGANWRPAPEDHGAYEAESLHETLEMASLPGSQNPKSAIQI